MLYDKHSDELTVDAHNQSLELVLRHVATHTGVEIKMDPSLEQPITITLEKQPVKSALERLARQNRLNYVMSTRKLADDSISVTGFYLLKEGNMSAADLPPLIDPSLEALVHMKRVQDAPGAGKLQTSWQRYEARLNALPPDVREEMTAAATRTLEKRAEKIKVRAERKAEKAAEREAKQAERTARLEKLKAEDPEAYKRRMERREEIRQQVHEEKRKEGPPQIQQ